MVVKGKKLTLKEHWQRLRQELHGMTPKQRLEHLWEYYKWVLLVIGLLVLIVGTVIGSINSLNTQLRLAGALINVDVSMDGYVMLQEGYMERIGGEKGKDAVELHNMQFENPYTTTDQTYALDVHESVVSMVAADVLDYIMFDDLALPFFLDPELLLDLRELFTQEELEAMGTAVIKLQMPETGETIPIAIDIRDTVFFREQMETDKNIYLAFSVRTPRKEACRDFWHFIKGGTTQRLETVLAGSAVDVPMSAQAEASLSDGFFESQGYVPGDQRVDFTAQSLVQSETDEAGTADLVKENLLQTLNSGALDYILCDENALAVIREAALLDLSEILSEQELEAMAANLVYGKDPQSGAQIPVAVDISALPFVKDNVDTQGPVYLAFGAASQRLEAGRALWQYILAISQEP